MLNNCGIMEKVEFILFPVDMSFDLVFVIFAGITTDFKVWLSGDFVLEPSEKMTFSQN